MVKRILSRRNRSTLARTITVIAIAAITFRVCRLSMRRAGTLFPCEITCLADTSAWCIATDAIGTESIKVKIYGVETLVVPATASTKGLFRRTRSRVAIVRIHTVRIIGAEGATSRAGVTNGVGSHVVAHVGLTEVI